jgi:hypothetical protein
MSIDDSLPNDVEALKLMVVAERAARLAAQSEAQYRALLIEKLKFTIKKLRHERFGQSAERGALLEQLELELADLEEDAGQAEAAARIAAASAAIAVSAFGRRKPARRPLPDYLPRDTGWSFRMACVGALNTSWKDNACHHRLIGTSADMSPSSKADSYPATTSAPAFATHPSLVLAVVAAIPGFAPLIALELRRWLRDGPITGAQSPAPRRSLGHVAPGTQSPQLPGLLCRGANAVRR